MLNDIVFMEAVQYIVTALLGVVAAWLVLRLSPSALKSARDAWVIARAYHPMLIAGVDQPGDPINARIDRVLDKFVSADWGYYSSVALPVLLRSVANALDEVLAAPPQEHIPADSPGEAGR